MDRSSYQQVVRSVDWKQLPGAYGADLTLEENLLAAASADGQAAYQALGKVLAHVCHQNVLAAPAPEVAACLLRISEIEEPVFPWVGLFGVGYLLAAAWSMPRDFFPPRPMSFAGEQPPQPLEILARQEAYDALSFRLLEVVEAATARLCELLAHPDPRTRAQSARLLAVGRREGESVRQALTAACDREEDDAVRGGLLLALACRLSRAEGAEAELLDRLRRAVASNGALESIGAAAALLLLDPGECLARHAQVVRAGLRFQSGEAPYLFLSKFPWSNGRVPDSASGSTVSWNALLSPSPISWAGLESGQFTPSV